MLLFLLLFCGSGALFIALAVPLLRGRVKPNPTYGLRTPETLADPRVWYAANAYAARLGLRWGVAVIAAAVGLFLARLPEHLYVLACTALLLVGAVSMGVGGMRYARKLARSGAQR